MSSMSKPLFSAVLSALFIAFTAPCFGADQKMTLKGSDTMVPLVTVWSERFMELKPEAAVAVTGGGSGTGIAALLNGTTEICASSREMSAEERAQAQQKGIKPHEITVAYDGISIVVHQSNPVKELTMEQLKQIFTGQYTNWKQVGGPDLPIAVLSRESSSGTFVFFQEHVLAKKDYAPHTRFMPATSGIVQAVSTDKGGIGYVGMAYAEQAGGSVKVLGIKKAADAPAVLPTEENVKNKTYSVARPLYFYTNGEPSGVVQEFVQFATGAEGQALAREEGYVPLR